jgi:hypothetical protein
MKRPRKIEAKRILEDIRSGMDDLSLMNKYELSAKGLQSLFEQLGNIGLVRRLNARELLEDIRSGVGQDGLIEKYQLSENGLQRLFEELDRAGLLKHCAQPDNTPAKITVNINQVAADIRHGLGRGQLTEKYRLTSRALRWVCMELVSNGLLSWKELYEKLSSSSEGLVLDKPRESRRYTLGFDVEIHEAGHSEAPGKVRDVTQRGIGVSGMRAKVDERKTLVIAGDEFGEFATFTFDAVCRWASRAPGGDYLAGFEVSYISVRSMGEFRVLIRLAAVSRQQ